MVLDVRLETVLYHQLQEGGSARGGSLAHILIRAQKQMQREGENNRDQGVLEHFNRRNEVITTSTTQEQAGNTRHLTEKVDQSTAADHSSSDICMSWTAQKVGAKGR